MKPRQGKWPLLAVVGLLLVSAGCTATLHPLPAPEERITEPETLIKKIIDRQRRISTVSTTGRINSVSKAGPLRGRITTLVSASRQVRFEAWTPTWDLVGSFVGDADTFMYFQRGQDYCLFGNSAPETIDRVLPLGIDFEQYVTTLMGTPPVPDQASWTIEFDRRCGCWLLTGITADGTAYLVRADADGSVRRSTVLSDGRVLIDIRFGAFNIVTLKDGTVRFPTEISFEIPRKKSRAELKFKEVEINGDIEDGDWDQVCPDGLRPIMIR